MMAWQVDASGVRYSEQHSTEQITTLKNTGDAAERALAELTTHLGSATDVTAALQHLVNAREGAAARIVAFADSIVLGSSAAAGVVIGADEDMAMVFRSAGSRGWAVI